MRRREWLQASVESDYSFADFAHMFIACQCVKWDRQFTVHGVTFTVTVPNCRIDIGYWNGGDWMDWLSKMLGIAIVHKNDLEGIAAKRSPDHIRPYDWPSVYEPLRNRHVYYCLRDVVHLMPKKTLCHWCGKPVQYPERHMSGKRHRAWFDPLSRTYQYEYFCSEACRMTAQSLERLMRLCQYERRVEFARQERREYERRRRELKWVRQGRALLNQCQHLIRNPAKLREASLSQSAASAPDGNSPPS